MTENSCNREVPVVVSAAQKYLFIHLLCIISIKKSLLCTDMQCGFCSPLKSWTQN